MSVCVRMGRQQAKECDDRSWKTPNKFWIGKKIGAAGRSGGEKKGEETFIAVRVKRIDVCVTLARGTGGVTARSDAFLLSVCTGGVVIFLAKQTNAQLRAEGWQEEREGRSVQEK